MNIYKNLQQNINNLNFNNQILKHLNSQTDCLLCRKLHMYFIAEPEIMIGHQTFSDHF